MSIQAHSRWRLLPLAAALGGLLLLAGAVPASAARPPQQAKGFSFSSSSYSATEYTDATVAITVTRPTPYTKVATVQFTTSDGTATAPTDYDSVTTTLSFAAGVGSIDTNITIKPGTETGEPDETVNLTLSNPSKGAKIGVGTAVLTIHPEPAPPAPTSVSVAKPDTFAMHVTWTSNGGSTYQFKVYRSTKATTDFSQKFGPTTFTGFWDSSYSPDVTYYYYVAAINHEGLATNSTTASVRSPYLIPNGGFEDGDFTHWTPDALVGSVTVSDTAYHYAGGSYDGSHSAVLDASSAAEAGHAYLDSDPFTTPTVPAGWMLTLSYYYEAQLVGSDTATVNLFDVTAGNNTVVYTRSFNSLSANTWTQANLPSNVVLLGGHNYVFQVDLAVAAVPSTSTFYLDDLVCNFS